MVNTYAAQSGGCRFESLWGFGFSLKGAYYEVGYCGKKTFLAGLQCTLTSSCAIAHNLSLHQFKPPLIFLGLKKKLLSVDEVSHSHLNVGEILGERIINTRSLHLNDSAYECIIHTRSFHRTRNDLLSAVREI